MSKVKKTVITIILLIVISAIGMWSILFQDIEIKINNGEHVVLVFSADWCRPCQKQKPIFQKVKAEFPEVNFYSIGAGSDLNKARRKILGRYYDVKGLPHFIIFKDGKEQMRLRGLQTQEKLIEAFSK